MDRTSADAGAPKPTSDGMLIALPIVAVLMVLFPIGPIGAVPGLLLASLGLALASSREPSLNRTCLMICSIIAMIGTAAVTVALIVIWLN